MLKVSRYVISPHIVLPAFLQLPHTYQSPIADMSFTPELRNASEAVLKARSEKSDGTDYEFTDYKGTPSSHADSCIELVYIFELQALSTDLPRARTSVSQPSWTLTRQRCIRRLLGSRRPSSEGVGFSVFRAYCIWIWCFTMVDLAHAFPYEILNPRHSVTSRQASSRIKRDRPNSAFPESGRVPSRPSSYRSVRNGSF